MVMDESHTWIGLEYFCNENDELWRMEDDSFKGLAIHELELLGFVTKQDVLDATVIRMPKTYLDYFGTCDRFDEVREFVDPIDNFFLVGRNGMHRYNNQDHSMLRPWLPSTISLLAALINRTFGA